MMLNMMKINITFIVPPVLNSVVRMMTDFDIFKGRISEKNLLLLFAHILCRFFHTAGKSQKYDSPIKNKKPDPKVESFTAERSAFPTA
jgi:hypothetical protein